MGSNAVAAVARGMLEVLGVLASPRLSILTFHRVHARIDTLFPHEPDAARFDRLMRHVAHAYRIMTLGRAVDLLAQGCLPSRALVITFDDGYADNAEVALPVLKRYGLPATFFVSTGFLDGGRMWNDTVIECLRASRRPEVDLASFGLGVFPLKDAADRRRAIESMLPRIKYASLPEREESLERLQQLCGVDALPTGLMMRSEQVLELSRAGMEIGAHTVRHPILTTLTAEEAESEIEGGRRELQFIINEPVDMFAYPNGKPGRDYDQGHVALVRKLGFRGAVSTAPGVSRTGDDLFQLPRYTPWGESTAVWGARLMFNQFNTRFEVAGREP